MRDCSVHLFDTAYCLASPHHLLRCNLASFRAVFLSPRACRIPLLSSRSLLSFSLAPSLTLAFSHMLSYCLAHFHFCLSPISCTFLLICSLSPPSSTFSLSVLAPGGKWRYVNCFLLHGCPTCYLSILMNSFPPFFPKSSRWPKVSCHLCHFLVLFMLTASLGLELWVNPLHWVQPTDSTEDGNCATSCLISTWLKIIENS